MKHTARKILSSAVSMSMMLTLLSGVTYAAGADHSFELTYQLTGDHSDLDNDGYLTYDLSEQVDVELKLTNKTNAPKTVQAFDFYVENASDLTRSVYTPYNGNGSIMVTEGGNRSTSSLSHIQLIGEKQNGEYVNRGITIPANGTVTLGTLTYNIAASADYNEALPITIITGNDKVPNLAISEDERSYYPDITSSVNGVEHFTQYTVTYMDGDVFIGTETKNHGSDYTVQMDMSESSTEYLVKDMTKPDHMYLAGWETRGDDNSRFDFSNRTYSGNDDITLYAIWVYQSYGYSYVDIGGNDITRIGTWPSVQYGEYADSTNYNGDRLVESLTRSGFNPNDYVFVGWTPSVEYNGVQYASTVYGYPFPGFVGEVVDVATYPIQGTTVFNPVYRYVENRSVTFAVGEDGPSVVMPEMLSGLTPHTYISEPVAPTAEGYTFQGWYKDYECTEAWNFEEDYITDSRTLYAKYTRNSYTVTLEENGGNYGNNVTEPTGYTYGTAVTLPTASDISKTGYIFSGWYASSDLSGTAVTSISSSDTGNKTFYAKWTPITYTIVFHANGGQGTMDDQTFTYDVTQSLTANAFTKNGRTFSGWSTTVNPADNSSYTYADLAGITNLTAINNATIDLYAVWSTDEFTITYDLGGGTVNGTNPTTYSANTEAFTLINPTRTGYIFTGWTGTGLDSHSTEVTIATESTGNRTYTANWTPADYTITLDNNGGSGSTSLNYNIESTSTLPTPSKAGYDFTGWKATDVDGNWVENYVYTAGTAVTDKYGDVTLTAQWTPTAYEITFNTAGGDAINAMSYDIESTDLLPTAAKTGYSFAGWKVTTAGGNWIADAAFSAGDTVTGQYGNVTLTAQWTAVTYTISYAGLEGATVSGNPASYTIESSAITLNNPTKTGYTFTGWTGTGLDNSSSAVTIAAGSTGDRTYTATWQLNTYEVTFVDEDGNEVDTVPYTVVDPTITPPAVPEKPGYTGAWETYTIDPSNPYDIEVEPVYTTIDYTITFDTAGGNAISGMAYTIESTGILPSATGRANYTFNGWKVTTEAGNWEANSVINGGTSVQGKYGNVTLTAQWTTTITGSIDEYKYAYTGYKMLRIDASGLDSSKVYTYDGTAMYYTADEAYALNGNPVFYTLIPTEATVLTDDIIGNVSTATASRVTISYNGDVNGDGTVNIADANTVFQMLSNNSAGGYYTADQLTVRDRLAADTSRAADNTDHRGSIEDVNFIVDIVNDVEGT